MNRFLGGEIECDVTQLSQPPRHRSILSPHSNKMMLDTGRSAILVALQNIARHTKVRKAWLPAYCCQAVLAPFESLGFKVNFYSLGDRLNSPVGLPDPDRNSVFLYIHYFGKINQTVREWLRKLNSPRRFFVIEDRVHASLNTDIGRDGAYAVTSFRKFLQQPDGAFLSSVAPLRGELAPPDEAFVTRKFVGKLLRQQKSSEGLFLQLFQQAERSIELKPRRMSFLSTFLLQRTDLDRIRRARRKNWLMLHKFFNDQTLSCSLVPLFNHLEPGEVPLGFPIRVLGGHRDALRDYLRAQDVFCAVHWDLAHLPKAKRWSLEFELSRSILTLPIDQRMGHKSIRRLVSALKIFSLRST